MLCLDFVVNDEVYQPVYYKWTFPSLSFGGAHFHWSGFKYFIYLFIFVFFSSPELLGSQGELIGWQ